MNIIYDLIFLLGLLIYLPVLFLRGKWHKDFGTRFGRIPQEIRSQRGDAPAIWFHAVSVGEVMAVMDLIKQTRRLIPDVRLVLSTVTPTGHALAQSRLGDICLVIYAPLDLGPAVRAYIDMIDPKLYVSAETEIWPNLISRLKDRGVPVVICNGRLSESSFRQYRLFGFLFKRVFERIDAFCMQTEQDAGRIRALGGRPERIHTVGNLKFDIAPSGRGFKKTDLGFRDEDPVWIAGSTHPGEEEIVLSVYSRVRERHPSLRLILAPRHVERADSIAQTVRKKGFSFRFLSEALSGNPQDFPVLIVNTIGDLRALYPLAAVVFMGKSLKGKGGQNILEPAFYGRCVLTGPNMQNFQSATDQLLKEGGLIQIDSEEGLYSAAARLLDNPSEAEQTGQKARAMVLRHQGATQKTIEILQKFIWP